MRARAVQLFALHHLAQAALEQVLAARPPAPWPQEFQADLGYLRPVDLWGFRAAARVVPYHYCILSRAYPQNQSLAKALNLHNNGFTMKTNKTMLMAIGAIVLVIVFFYLPKASPVTAPEPPENEIQMEQKATVSVDFSDESVISNEFEISNETTAYSLLQKIAESMDLELETTQYDFGVFVKAINGRESTAEMSWIYFVNGNSGDVAADQKQINAGDTVEWKYLAPNE